MTQEELNTILEKHKKWVLDDIDGVHADLSRADLSDTHLCGVDLYRAYLSDANLHNANLFRANLYGADLCNAYLSGANLRDANLRYASFDDANLRYANLYDADLRGADLRGADICGANLCNANLRDADLRGAKNVPFIPFVCPEEGSFIGFKKAYNSTIVKLEIPADAKRSSATTRKCRCNKAKVLSIQTLDGEDANIEMICSRYDDEFVYEVGKTVEVKDFDEDRWNECSTGIHFFINRQEAVDY